MLDMRSASAGLLLLLALPASARANCAYAEQKAYWNEGKATCTITVTNNCPQAIVCDVDMRGTAVDGRPATDIKSNVSVAPRDAISAGLTDVRSCGNWRWSCR